MPERSGSKIGTLLGVGIGLGAWGWAALISVLLNDPDSWRQGAVAAAASTTLALMQCGVVVLASGPRFIQWLRASMFTTAGCSGVIGFGLFQGSGSTSVFVVLWMAVSLGLTAAGSVALLREVWLHLSREQSVEDELSRNR